MERLLHAPSPIIYLELATESNTPEKHTQTTTLYRATLHQTCLKPRFDENTIA
jgi:hypothetical protein